jgi:hypothetical protein
VEDLYVGNTLYEGDNILKGWHEHFHNLAQPSDDPDFDTRFKQQCQQDYITIKSIYDKIIPKVVTMDELKVIWIVRGLCQIMKVFVPAFKYIVAFI